MAFETYIQFSELKPDTVAEQVDSLCQAAIEQRAGAVCVPPLFVKRAKELLKPTGIPVSTVIGFPYGYAPIEAKLAEVVLAVVDGADGLDVVINTAAVKNSDWQYLANEINHLLTVMRAKGRLVSVILETALLTEAEIIKACDIYGVAAVDYVCIGTGTMANNLLAEHLNLIRSHLADPVKIKVMADSISRSTAVQFIDAGASLISLNNAFSMLSTVEK